MLPAILASVGIPLLTKVLSGTLSASGNELAKAAGDALGRFGKAVDEGVLAPGERARMEEALSAVAAAECRRDAKVLGQVNRTIRAELSNSDTYVRRMRPTFGYVMAASWAAQMGALAWVSVTDPGKAASLITAMSNLGTIWGVGLSVLGLYVYGRTKEKQADAVCGAPSFTSPGVPDEAYEAGAGKASRTGQEGR